MQRVNQILEADAFKEYLGKNEQAEANRKFCHHDMGHFLDVARIAMIINKEEQYGVETELIYAAALLHDIGRWQQYEDGTPHEKASAVLAPDILQKCGFDKKEIALIVKAISRHRDSEVKEQKDLDGLLYRADKLSRPCFSCKAEKDCKWKGEKKNKYIVW